MWPLEHNKECLNSYEPSDGIPQDILCLTFPFAFMEDFFFFWPTGFVGNFSLTATEQEMTQGHCEVFPFTLGTREILIKANEQMLYFRI